MQKIKYVTAWWNRDGKRYPVLAFGDKNTIITDIRGRVLDESEFRLIGLLQQPRYRVVAISGSFGSHDKAHVRCTSTQGSGELRYDLEHCEEFYNFLCRIAAVLEAAEGKEEVEGLMLSIEAAAKRHDMSCADAAELLRMIKAKMRDRYRQVV